MTGFIGSHVERQLVYQGICR